MRKVMFVALILSLVAGLGSRPVHAQDKKVEFSLNLGVVASSPEGIRLVLSPQLDIHPTKRLMISAEAMFCMIGDLTIYPGVIINYTVKRVFAGLGIALPIAPNLFGGAEVDAPLLKLNIGYRGKRINLTTYLMTSTQEIFSENLVGATIGYRF
jgi:hypothetical protein